MDAWSGPFYAAALLLAGAGAAKVWDPVNTVGALRTMGITVRPLAVRVGGAIEVVVGLAAIVTGAMLPALLVAASYLVFTAFVAVALHRDLPIGSCGCFGKVDTPPSPIHLVVNLAAAAVAVIVALGDPIPLADVLGDQPAAGIPFVVLTVVAAGSAFLALTALPRLQQAVREVRSR
jgi:hypothetical protein